MSAIVTDTQTIRFSALLRRVWPADAAKHAAQAAGCSVRTTQKWLADVCSPSADALIRLARSNDALRAELIRSLQPEIDPYAENPSSLNAADGACAAARRHNGGGSCG